MFLSKIRVEGFRAADVEAINCDLPGRFSVLLGANGSGKSTIADAILASHPDVFPWTPRMPSASLSKTISDRSIGIEYAFESEEQIELWRMRRAQGSPPGWVTSLTSSVGRVVPDTLAGNRNDFRGQLPVLYLSPTRAPNTDLSGRNAQLIVELLRSENLRVRGSRSLSGLRRHLGNLIGTLLPDPPLSTAEERVTAALRELSVGVSLREPFLATTEIDDAFVARVFEFLLSSDGGGRALSRRLEIEALGYANLLEIAVVLAAIPDLCHAADPDADDADTDLGAEANDEPAAVGETVLDDERTDEDRRQELAEAEDQQAIIDESLFPDQFHAVVLLEEPEAHLHPQLQHGLVRYLKQVVETRPELQVILTTHSDEIISACDPNDLVVLRRSNGVSRAISVGALDLSESDLARMRRHLDVSRSASLFAEHVVLVEGVTDAMILRSFGRVWAAGDPDRQRFVDALTITVVGSRVGPWLPNLLTAPDREVVGRLAVLMDSDGRAMPEWASSKEGSFFQAFLSDPTLEPSLVEGNEAVVDQAFVDIGVEAPWASGSPTADALDAWFRASGRRRKADFSEAFVRIIEADPEGCTVPPHLRSLLDFVYGDTGPDAQERAADEPGGSASSPGADD